MPFNSFVWMLWSVKESVFKYQNRQYPDLLFSPRKIIIQSIDCPKYSYVTKFGTAQYEQDSLSVGGFFNCTAHVGSAILYSRSKIYEDLIFTVAGPDGKFENISSGVKFMPNTGYEEQSKEVRSFVLNRLVSAFPGHDLTIKKSAIGYPVLLIGSQEMNVPLSFSHHGHFVAYSFVCG